MNALTTIATTLKTALAAAAGDAAIVRRCYVPPDYDTAATSELRILVIGLGEDVDVSGPNTTRSQCDHLYEVKVAIVKRVSAPDVTSEAALAELDALSDRRELVIDFLKATREIGDATLDTLKNTPATYDPAMLDQKKVYVSVITLTYRRLR